MTSVLLWQAGNGGFRGPFEDRSVYPSTRFFLGALDAGHLQEKISAVISSAWINTCALHCSHQVSEQPLLGLYLGQRRPISYSMICETSQDSVSNSFLLVQPSASAVMGRYCLHRLPRRALARGEKQGWEVEGPISSGSTLLWYTHSCRTLSFEAITER